MNLSGVPTEPIAQKTFNVNDTWYNWFSNLLSQMQEDLSDEGYVIPGLTQEQLDMLETKDGQRQKIVYNSTTEKMNLNNTGLFEEIATTMLLSSEQIAEMDLSTYRGFLVNTTTFDIYACFFGTQRKIILGDPLDV